MFKRNIGWIKSVNSFDSKFEEKLAKGVLKNEMFHVKEHYQSYTVSHTYQPDFIHEKKDGTFILIEAKGRFLESADASRYIRIQDQLPPNYRLVFLFYDKDNTMPGAQKRKNGSYYTMEEWANRNDIEWYTEDNVGVILDE